VASDTYSGGYEDEKKEQVDSALIKKAVEKLQAVIRGNGLKPEDVKLKHFEGEIISFEAFGVFKIEPSVSEKRVPGKEQGELASTYTDAQQRIKAALQRIIKDREVRKYKTDLLKKREDLGFGVDNLIVHLERLNKKFVLHEPCSPCHATGKILCRNCQGKRQIPCTACRGQRQVICPACRGTHYINGPKGRQQCLRCHARGRVMCKMCKQTGFMQCPKCKTSGKMRCSACSATGWNSRIFHVGVKAKGKFIYNRDILPKEMPPLIDELGPAIVLEDHGQVRLIEEPRRDEELDKLSPPDELVIPYLVRLAWGDIGFLLGEEEVRGKLFGFTPLLAHLPPVLEKIMRDGLNSLSQASQGKGNVAQHIGKAIRFRAIGETFLAALPHLPGRAMEMMAKRYPYGFGDQTIPNMVVQANLALKHLTRKPRLQGLGIGAVMSGGLFAAYFIGPLREIILSRLASLPEFVADVGMVLLGGAAITVSIHLTTAQVLQKTLGALVQKTKNNIKLAPKPAESLFWGYPAAILLFVAVMQLSIMRGGEPPDWTQGALKHPKIQQQQNPR